MESEIERLEDAFTLLKENPCWAVAAGSGTGSVFSLGFGGRIPRLNALRNRHLSKEYRENEAEYALFVECVWRLDASDRVICGAWDDNVKDGPMLTGLSRLIGHRVVDVALRRPGLDLEVLFDHALRLTIFCDQVSEHSLYDNYSVFLPEVVFIVGTKSALRSEDRKPRPK